MRSAPASRACSALAAGLTAGLTPDASSRTRTSTGPATGVGLSPRLRTSIAGPQRSYQTARIRLQRAREGATVEQDVLTGDEAGFRAAQERAGQAELFGIAK